MSISKGQEACCTDFLQQLEVEFSIKFLLVNGGYLKAVKYAQGSTNYSITLRWSWKLVRNVHTTLLLINLKTMSIASEWKSTREIPSNIYSGVNWHEKKGVTVRFESTISQ